MVQVSKHFVVSGFFPRQAYLPHPLTATRSIVHSPQAYFRFLR